MSALTGTGAVLRLALRRDRRSTLVWAGLLALMAAATVRRYTQMFPTDAARRAFAASLEDNRTLIAFGGRIASPTLGGLVAFKVGSSLYNLVALMALLAVVRGTRAEEESGRGELLASGRVGRLAPLAATLIAVVIASVLCGAVIAAALAGLGLPAGGALVMGLQASSGGVFFAAVAAVAAQLAATARGANGLAGLALGGSYVARFGADMANQPGLRWLAPEGWAHMMSPFGGERPGVVVVPLLGAGLLVALALRLASRRDYGTAVLPQRAGRAEGPALRSPLALALRLHRTPLRAWSASFVALSVLLGALGASVPQLTSQGGSTAREFFRRYGNGAATDLTDAFFWLIALSLGYVIALLPALTVLRLRAEESSGNAELLLSTPVSRTRLLLSHVAVALAGPALILTASGLLVALVHGLDGGAALARLPRILVACAEQSAAVWTLGGVAALAFAWLPRQSVPIGWAAFVYVNVFGEVLGPGLGLDAQSAERAVPFHYLPRVLTGGALHAERLAALLALTAVMLGLGVVGFRRRDVG